MTEINWNNWSLSDGNEWRLYYDEYRSYPENFIAFLNRGIALQEEECLSKILACICVCNTKISRILPIIFTFGKSRSGKSKLGYLLAAFRNETANILASKSTFAAIRNRMHDLRWHLREAHNFDYSLSNEKPYILVWADIKEANLLKGEGDMFALFRNGAYRSEEKITVYSRIKGYNSSIYQTNF